MKIIKLVFSILLTLFIFSAKSQTIKLDSGLMASYPFNGNALDESGTGNHGVVNEAVLVDDRFGVPNSAYWFDGISSFIIVPDHNSLDMTTSLSITGWMKKDTHVPWASMVTKGGETGQLEVNNYTIHNDTGTSVVFTGHPWGAPNSRISVPVQEWHFIAFTYDGDTGKFFIDGTADSLSFVYLEGDLVPNYSSLFIGVDHPGATEFFHGCLDDIRIYNRALNVEEIEYLYHYKQDFISLNAGWNLISLDVIPDNSTPQSVFATQIANGNLQMVTGFQNQQGVFYDPDGLPVLNTLQNLNPGQGYWVKVQNTDTLTVIGQSFSSNFSINLVSGWNLIGYWPQITTTPEQAFALLLNADILQMVTSYEQGGKFFDPNGPPYLNTLTEIKNGFGYWVKVSAAVNSFSFP